MSRIITSGRLAYAQADFFEFGRRKTDVRLADLQAVVFVDGRILPWSVADGTFVPDSSAGAGFTYFSEVAGAAGFYLLRFFPDRPGFWRIILTHATLGEQIFEFDATSPLPSSSGLQASFS